MTYKLIEYTDDLDLKEFYETAALDGAMNNISKQVMVDCFRNEREFKGFVLLQDDKPVGFSAYHSLDLMGQNCYRICARNYVHARARNLESLSNGKRIMSEHQNTTAQFFIPKFIELLGDTNRLFITTNRSFIASQRAVHTLYMPTLQKLGLAQMIAEEEYRGHYQTFWQINSQEFMSHLNNYPRW
jgi:hypothetical protein